LLSHETAIQALSFILKVLTINPNDVDVRMALKHFFSSSALRLEVLNID